ncbi:MAG: Holliday junction branch migration protein RuvA [Kiritimatiellae bacterium]|nr:Holliday junction branch migration protein RuvA [Kiritimatiellia bacterium]MBR4250854.1 Holliday junction branch migration protein RuvA [Kiritimatiellia bacterium]
MIVFLEGILDRKEPHRAVMNVNGVGYEAAIALSTFDRLPAEGSRFRLLTLHVVREDAHLLYGFADEEERNAFLLVTAVNGIGPKLGLALLSGMPVRELKAAIVNGDVKRLSSVSGIGKKSAERIVLELRDKIGKGDAMEAIAGEAPSGPVNAKLRDALAALVSLGHKQADAQQLIRAAMPKITEEMDVGDILRRILSGKM